MYQRIAPAFMSAVLLLQYFPMFFSKNSQTQQSVKYAPAGRRPLPVKEQATEGGLWRTDNGFQTSVMIGNIVELHSVTVTPVLYMADGTAFDLAPVELAPAGVATINVNNALQNAPASLAPHISSYGSVGIHYQWSWNPAIATSVRIFDDVRSLVYIPHLAGDALQIQDAAAPQGQQALEGMWWKVVPEMGGFVSLTNRSLSPVAATLSVFDSGGANTVSQPITLAPHSTQLFDLTLLWNQLPLISAQGGIRISYSGSKGALVAYGGLEDDAKGYSHELRFTYRTFDTGSLPAPSSPQSITLAATGIMMGAQDPDMQFPADTRFQPYLVLRNTTPQPLQIQLTSQAGDSAMLALGNVSLPPLGVQQVDLQTLLKGLGLSGYNGMLNLGTSYQGQPGDLLEAVGSVDQTLNYVFEVPARREAWSQSRILNYWNTAGDNDTMATLWNYTGKDQDLVLTLFHAQGKYKLPIHLRAHTSTTISFASLIRKATPDPDGNVIPANIVQGRAKLSGSKGNSDKIDVAISVAGYNVRTATCGCYQYWCDGITDWYFVPDSPTIDVQETTTLIPTVEYYDASTSSDISAYGFSSNDGQVATVDGAGDVTGQSAGTATITAVSGDMWPTAEYGCGCDPEATCNYTNIGYQTDVMVPLTTSQSTPLWFFGNGVTTPNGFTLGSTEATITADGANGTYVWTITNGTSKAAFENQSSTITKTNANTVGISSISYSTSLGDVTVQLQFTPSGGSQMTVSYNLQIDSPYELQSDGLPNDRNVTGCALNSPSGSNGYQSLVPYFVSSYFGATDLNQLPINEIFQQRMDVYSPNNWTVTAVGGVTDGTFADELCFAGGWSPHPLPPQPQLSSEEIFNQQQVWRAGSSTLGDGLELQIDTQHYYIDHGRVTNVVSPVPGR